MTLNMRLQKQQEINIILINVTGPLYQGFYIWFYRGTFCLCYIILEFASILQFAWPI